MRFWIALFSLLALAAPAGARTVEMGGFVGYHAPVTQEDASDDITVGLRLRTPLAPILHVETLFAYYDMDRGPYRVRSVIQEVQPWYILSAGAGLVVGRGFTESGYHPYGALGIGLYWPRKDERDEGTRVGLRGAVGLVAGMTPEVSVDLSAAAIRIALDNGASRGLLDLSAGVNYHFEGP